MVGSLSNEAIVSDTVTLSLLKDLMYSYSILYFICVDL